MTEDLHPSTHPPLPPTTEDDRMSWLRLLRSRRVGPATFYRLMAEHKSAAAALEALPEVANSAGVSNYTPCPIGVVDAELNAGASVGARLLAVGEPEYPAELAQLADAPPLLWVMGQAISPTKPVIAIVGARNASSLGLRMARNLAEALSERGCIVTSGLARGIDAAAHSASLDRGTIAVMAGGVDVMYPAENTHLAQDILQNGMRVSEMPIGMVPQARHFPARNRIISGMSKAVVVIEAAAKSGSLITARNALDQGREVLAVPGHPFDIRAAGCNMLIRDGATLVRNAEDIMQALPAADKAPVQTELALDPRRPATEAPPVQSKTAQSRPARRQPATPQPSGPAPAHAEAHAPSHTRAQVQRQDADISAASPGRTRSLKDIARLHGEILDRLGPSPLAEDQLIRDLSASASAINPVLTDLEIQGHIMRLPGGLVSLT